MHAGPLLGAIVQGCDIHACICRVPGLLLLELRLKGVQLLLLLLLRFQASPTHLCVGVLMLCWKLLHAAVSPPLLLLLLLCLHAAAGSLLLLE